jgi:predicted SAM-dependent methyltransferase
MGFARYLADHLINQIEISLSEDVLEHFFYNEQVYILCAMNVALENGGVFRVLMPSLDKLLGNYSTFSGDNKEDWYVKYFGIRSNADMVNLGMRFGGHRWLHNELSFAVLAQECGFEKISTSCQISTVDELNNLNLRDETNSLSFANDLVKTKPVIKWTILPASISNASQLGYLTNTTNIPIFCSTGTVQIEYKFPSSLRGKDIVLLNFRSTNISQFREHNYSGVRFITSTGQLVPFSGIIPIDSSLRSRVVVNMLSYVDFREKSKNETVVSVQFVFSQNSGDYFTVGPLEVFFIA